jgi:hypothetical protein
LQSRHQFPTAHNRQRCQFSFNKARRAAGGYSRDTRRILIWHGPIRSLQAS